MNEPFVPFHRPSIGPEELAAVQRVLESKWLTTGPATHKFEQEFANYLGVKRVVGVANGTDALRLALLALGVGAGDEVITVPMTFIATAASIVQTGARPVLVDIDPETCNISLPKLRKLLEKRLPGERANIKAIACSAVVIE